MMEEVSLDSEETEYIDLIEFLQVNPIPLLSASKNEIAQIPGISELTAKRIIDFLDDNQFTSYSELADSLNLSPEIEILLQYCTSPTKSKNDTPTSFNYRGRYISRLGNIKGFEDDRFQGNALDYFQRMKYINNNYEIGFLTNKDLGERQFADFYSGFAKYENENIKLILGDYALEAGFGSTMWRAFGLRKSAIGFNSALNEGRGLVKYSSALETNFFRGAAADYNFQTENINFSSTFFYSNRDKAANIDEETGEVSSIDATGLFRTDTEIAKKNQLNEQIFGTHNELNYKDFELGFTSYFISYDRIINSESSSDFKGKNGLLTSLYGIYEEDNYRLIAEAALDAQQNLNFKTGYLMENQDLDIMLYYRYSDVNYLSPFGFNFGEFSYAANESGLFAAIRIKSIDKMNIALFTDMYQSNGSTFLVPGRVRGLESELQIDYRISKYTDMIIRLDYEEKTGSIRDENNDKFKYDPKRYSVRLDIKKDVTRNLMFRIRGEMCFIDQVDFASSESGLMSFAEIKWKPFNMLTVGARSSIFSTDSYNSAIWQFEYAMPGILSTRVLYEDGMRNYFYAKIEPFSFLDIWLRYAELIKNDIETSGSGLLEVEGNQDRQFFMQIEIDL